MKFDTSKLENGARIAITAAVGLMAGAASFTHMHDWTMDNAPHGTADWFGWANAIISELMPTMALLEIRRRHKAHRPIGYPVGILIGSGLLSLAAQVSQANDTWTGRGLAALPALGFIVVTKLVFSNLHTTDDTATPEPLHSNTSNTTQATAQTPQPARPVPVDDAPSTPSTPAPPVRPEPTTVQTPVRPAVVSPMVPSGGVLTPARTNGAVVVPR